MAISLYGDLKYGDTAGLRQWMQRHELRHRAYARAMLRKGIQTPALPIAESFGKKWLIDHQTHHKLLNQLFVPGSTNEYSLVADPTASSAQFYAWMQAHNKVHIRIDRELNAVVRS